MLKKSSLKEAIMPVEQIAPGLERIVSPDQDVEELGKGYNLGEGPLWWKEGGYLLFSDVNNDRRMKWAPQEGISVFRQPPENGNGLTRDLQGRIISCGQTFRRMIRLESDGSVTPVAETYQGKKLNSPNDVIVHSSGAIYFTDPPFGIRPEQNELGYAGVFRIDPNGSLSLLVSDFEGPNGLAFSPDESILYINDSRKEHIRVFKMRPDGTLDMASDRVFCELKGDRIGSPDGMKVDVEGNVYCTGPGGVWIMDASGKHLGTILTGEVSQATNCAWGDDDWKAMYITTVQNVGRIRLKIAGIPVPPR